MSNKVEVESFQSSVPTSSSSNWSEPEKKMMCEMQSEEQLLPYPLVPLKLPNGTAELMYDIPECDKYEVLSKCWPLMPVPASDKILLDIHADKRCFFKDCNIIRYNERNLVVSPYYAEKGGTAIDLVEPDMTDDVLVSIGSVRNMESTKAVVRNVSHRKKERVRHFSMVVELSGDMETMADKEVIEQLKKRISFGSMTLTNITRIK